VGVVGRWLLAVGRSVLLLAQILHIVGIVCMHIPKVFFSGLKYLDRSKFFSGCPDYQN
jgi:hypothetical protein